MTKLAAWRDSISKIQRHLSGNGLSKFSSKSDLLQVFDGSGGRIDQKLFAYYYNAIPNVVEQSGINSLRAYDFFKKHYHEELRNHLMDIYFDIDNFKNKKPTAGEFYCFLYEDLMIHFDIKWEILRYFFFKTDIAKVTEIMNKLSQFYQEKTDQPEIHLLVKEPRGIDTKNLPLTKPKLDIDSNYNDDFLPIHETIFQRLNQQNDKGLVLLHGKPGTGKTSYLRFLATSLKKKIIFLPPDMASAVTNPNFIPLLMDNRNSILVIEDAEKIIMDRETNGHSPVSALLNLADGLLADCLNVQIICSFNTDLSKVDKALLRKGRLIAKYEFKELEAPKAQQLSNKLGFKTIITQPMTLTAVYNQEEKDFKEVNKRVSMGFNLGKTG